ncbi:MAG: hypothetical protein IJT08_01475, partial [Alphaproteobacteria bacterium]|nr:hypothetical protein [Alphaproteobacteria bacterium]
MNVKLLNLGLCSVLLLSSTAIGSDNNALVAATRANPRVNNGSVNARLKYRYMQENTTGNYKFCKASKQQGNGINKKEIEYGAGNAFYGTYDYGKMAGTQFGNGNTVFEKQTSKRMYDNEFKCYSNLQKSEKLVNGKLEDVHVNGFYDDVLTRPIVLEYDEFATVLKGTKFGGNALEEPLTQALMTAFRRKSEKIRDEMTTFIINNPNVDDRSLKRKDGEIGKKSYENSTTMMKAAISKSIKNAFPDADDAAVKGLIDLLVDKKISFYLMPQNNYTYASEGYQPCLKREINDIYDLIQKYGVSVAYSMLTLAVQSGEHYAHDASTKIYTAKTPVLPVQPLYANVVNNFVSGGNNNNNITAFDYSSNMNYNAHSNTINSTSKANYSSPSYKAKVSTKTTYKPSSLTKATSSKASYRSPSYTKKVSTKTTYKPSSATATTSSKASYSSPSYKAKFSTKTTYKPSSATATTSSKASYRSPSYTKKVSTKTTYKPS